MIRGTIWHEVLVIPAKAGYPSPSAPGCRPRIRSGAGSAPVWRIKEKTMGRWDVCDFILCRRT